MILESIQTFCEGIVELAYPHNLKVTQIVLSLGTMTYFAASPIYSSQNQ